MYSILQDIYNIKMENSLVSVCVITYNSARTIIETLESIKNQTYNRIELIISDDCSADETVDLCLEWLMRNEKRFIGYHLLKSSGNKGISANMNKAMECSSGEWIKPIAGDDMLINSCIQDYMIFVSLYPDALVLFSDMVTFGEKTDDDVKYNYIKPKRRKRVAEANWDLQFRYICYFGLFMSAPTMFIKRNVLEIVKNDERIPMMEDLPFHFNLLKNGIKLSYMQKYTVYYRISESLTNSSSRLLTPSFAHSQTLFHRYYSKFMPKTLFGNIVKIKNSYCDIINATVIRFSKNRRQSVIGRLYLLHDKIFEILFALLAKLYLRYYY